MADDIISNNDRVIPEPGVYDYTAIQLYINGSLLNNAQYDVKSLLVNKEVNVIPTARLWLLDGDLSQEKFAVSEGSDFIPGNQIEIKVGRDGNYTSLFKGLIVKQAIKAKERGGSYLQLDCKDAAVALTLGRKNKYFQDMSDADAIKQVLADKSGDVYDSGITHKELVQYYSTDWDFVVNRAEVNGCVALAKDGKVNIVQPAISGNPSLSLAYGSSIDEFEAEMDARTQWQQVTSSAWDQAGQSLLQASSSSSPVPEPGNISGSTLAQVVSPADYEQRHSGRISNAELKAWSDAAMLKSRLAKIRGRVKVKGSPATQPGDNIELKGLGDRFNGQVYVSGVRHDFTDGVWTTHIQFGLSTDWFSQQPEFNGPSAAGLTPGVQGLQIGVVVQLENDPDGEHRVLVKIPVIDGNAQGTWCRMASLDAGNNRGYYFRPEIGDEVIVGYINNDPRFAVVLGMLHSSAKPAPYTAQDSNPIKGLVTRSQMKTTYDDEKKITRIETPAGNFIELNENSSSISIQDQNGNSLKMESSGITIKSPGDVTIEASGSLSLKAQSSLSIEGLSISGKAQTSLEMNGQASAKVTASGQVQIQGAMVMIN